MKFNEKSVRKLDDTDFVELFRIVTLEMWRRLIHSLELNTGGRLIE